MNNVSFNAKFMPKKEWDKCMALDSHPNGDVLKNEVDMNLEMKEKLNSKRLSTGTELESPFPDPTQLLSSSSLDDAPTPNITYSNSPNITYAIPSADDYHGIWIDEKGLYHSTFPSLIPSQYSCQISPTKLDTLVQSDLSPYKIDIKTGGVIKGEKTGLYNNLSKPLIHPSSDISAHSRDDYPKSGVIQVETPIRINENPNSGSIYHKSRGSFLKDDVELNFRVNNSDPDHSIGIIKSEYHKQNLKSVLNDSFHRIGHEKHVEYIKPSANNDLSTHGRTFRAENSSHCIADGLASHNLMGDDKNSKLKTNLGRICSKEVYDYNVNSCHMNDPLESGLLTRHDDCVRHEIVDRDPTGYMRLNQKMNGQSYRNSNYSEQESCRGQINNHRVDFASKDLEQTKFVTPTSDQNQYCFALHHKDRLDPNTHSNDVIGHEHGGISGSNLIYNNGFSDPSVLRMEEKVSCQNSFSPTSAPVDGTLQNIDLIVQQLSQLNLWDYGDISNINYEDLNNPKISVNNLDKIIKFLSYVVNSSVEKNYENYDSKFEKLYSAVNPVGFINPDNAIDYGNTAYSMYNNVKKHKISNSTSTPSSCYGTPICMNSPQNPPFTSTTCAYLSGYKGANDNGFSDTNKNRAANNFDINLFPNEAYDCDLSNGNNRKYNFSTSQVISQCDILEESIRSLYDDQISPILCNISGRCKEMGCSHLIQENFLQCCSADSRFIISDMNDPKKCMILLRRVPDNFKGFIDPNSTIDNYGDVFWGKFSDWLQNLMMRSSQNQGDYFFKGGRYGMARRLKEMGLQFFEGFTLGMYIHVVQLAISKRKLLAYEDNVLKPVASCVVFAKALLGVPVGKKMVWNCVDNVDDLKLYIRKLLQSYPNGFNLSTLKRKIKREFNRELCQTIFHHTKLIDLITSPQFSDVCIVDKESRHLRPLKTHTNDSFNRLYH